MIREIDNIIKYLLLLSRSVSKVIFYPLLLIPVLLFTSCANLYLKTSSVAYQSIRTTFRQPDIQNIPDNVKIILSYRITNEGKLLVDVKNNTSEIMIIDQTNSFFINNGQSISYYDPTVKTSTDLASSAKGASVNLGALGKAVGIGGVVGKALSGVNVGGSNTTGTSNTTIIADQPRVSLGPKGNITMSKAFQINGIGKDYFLRHTDEFAGAFTKDNSICTFSVCISYSVDGGNTFQKNVTDFYVNSMIISPVKKHGAVNDALRTIYQKKTDALRENLWILYFNNNYCYKNILEGGLFDYQ